MLKKSHSKWSYQHHRETFILLEDTIEWISDKEYELLGYFNLF